MCVFLPRFGVCSSGMRSFTCVAVSRFWLSQCLMRSDVGRKGVLITCCVGIQMYCISLNVRVGRYAMTFDSLCLCSVGRFQ